MLNKKTASGNRYGISCLFSALASLLGFVNPVLSSFIVYNIINNFNLGGIIPSLVAMVIVKGTRMYLRSRVSHNLKGNMRAPLIWLQHRIDKRLWWLEPLVDGWGWLGMTVSKYAVDVSAQTAMFFATTVLDTLNALASGIVYYFTRSYVLSLMSVLIFPAFSVAPWYAGKTRRIRHYSKLKL